MHAYASRACGTLRFAASVRSGLHGHRLETFSLVSKDVAGGYSACIDAEHHAEGETSGAESRR
jgi:hypothetical protein